MTTTPENTLIVLALEAEAKDQFKDLSPLFCGVGKVNASYHLTRVLAAWKAAHGSPPKMVLNVGSAGSTSFKAGTVINCTRFIQRDFDVTPLGFEPYMTPFDDTPALLTNGERFHDYPEGICGTGDSFATDGLAKAWNVVDMEAYALAKVCLLENVPFGCLKYITDGADGHAADSWEAALVDAAEKLSEATRAVSRGKIKGKTRYTGPMKVLGIDFTSRPSRRKPITCARCTFVDGVLRLDSLDSWATYAPFEDALAQPGPWIAGLDVPFGQSRRFIETIGWPSSWDGYVAHAASLGRDGFRKALTAYNAQRSAGDKEHRRTTDKAVGSISPQKLYGVPVGLMFFEGAPRLLASEATIPYLKSGDPERVVVEAYPGILARTAIGRRSYKNDTRKKQTRDQHDARLAILQYLRDKAPSVYGFSVEADPNLCDDPGADHLDALLCAVQAAWAWTKRNKGYGAPERVDPLEGWIAHPQSR